MGCDGMDPFFDLGLLTYINLVCFLGAKQKIVMGWCASLSWLDVNSLGLQMRINAVWFWLLCVWGRR